MMKPAEVRVETNWSPTTLNGSSHATPLDAKSENAIGRPMAMATYISRMPIRNNEILMSIFLMSMKTTAATATTATRTITISMFFFFLLPRCIPVVIDRCRRYDDVPRRFRPSVDRCRIPRCQRYGKRADPVTRADPYGREGRKVSS